MTVEINQPLLTFLWFFFDFFSFLGFLPLIFVLSFCFCSANAFLSSKSIFVTGGRPATFRLRL